MENHVLYNVSNVDLWGCDSLMVSALVPGSCGLGLSHSAMFLGKTLYFPTASLHPGVLAAPKVSCYCSIGSVSSQFLEFSFLRVIICIITCNRPKQH